MDDLSIVQITDEIFQHSILSIQNMNKAFRASLYEMNNVSKENKNHLKAWQRALEDSAKALHASSAETQIAKEAYKSMGESIHNQTFGQEILQYSKLNEVIQNLGQTMADAKVKMQDFQEEQYRFRNRVLTDNEKTPISFSFPNFSEFTPINNHLPSKNTPLIEPGASGSNNGSQSDSRGKNAIALGGKVASAGIAAKGISNPYVAAGSAVLDNLDLLSGENDTPMLNSFTSLQDQLWREEMDRYSTMAQSGTITALQDSWVVDLYTHALGDSNRARQLVNQAHQVATETAYNEEQLFELFYTIMVRNPQRTNDEILDIVHLLTDFGDSRMMNTDDIHAVYGILEDILESGSISDQQKSILESYNIPVTNALNAELKGKGSPYGLIAHAMQDQYGGQAMATAENTLYGIQSIFGSMDQQLLSAWGNAYDKEWEKNAPELLEKARSIQEDAMAAQAIIGQYQAQTEYVQLNLYYDELAMTLGQYDFSAIDPYDFTNKDLKRAGIDPDQLMVDMGMANINAQLRFSDTDIGQQWFGIQANMLLQTGNAVMEHPTNIANAVTLNNLSGLGIKDDIGFKIRSALHQLSKNSAATSTPTAPTQKLFGGNKGVGGNKAFGLSYVPYDSYLARLHEGERVLTAAEARVYNAGRTPNITVAGQYVIREEADVYKIAQALATEIQRAQLVS